MKEGQTQKGSSQSAKSLILSSAITFWLEPGSSSPSVSYPRCRWSSHGPSSASLSLSLSLIPHQVHINDKKFAWYSAHPSPTPILHPTDEKHPHQRILHQGTPDFLLQPHRATTLRDQTQGSPRLSMREVPRSEEDSAGAFKVFVQRDQGGRSQQTRPRFGFRVWRQA